MDNVRVSIICVFNNKSQFESQLLKSLDNQDISYEMIALDNTEGAYASAAAALNAGAEISNGNILIFSHQDIFFKTQDGLRQMVECIEGLPLGCLVGTQGVKEKDKAIYSNLTAGECYTANLVEEQQSTCISVSCVDEGLFGLKKQTWMKHHFNESLCNGWHLYAVEFCLWARKNGYMVYTCPIQIHHFSYGKITRSYMQGLVRLADVYREDFKYIWTTCYKVKTSWGYTRGLYFVWILNRKLRAKSLN